MAFFLLLEIRGTQRRYRLYELYRVFLLLCTWYMIYVSACIGPNAGGGYFCCRVLVLSEYVATCALLCLALPCRTCFAFESVRNSKRIDRKEGERAKGGRRGRGGGTSWLAFVEICLFLFLSPSLLFYYFILRMSTPLSPSIAVWFITCFSLLLPPFLFCCPILFFVPPPFSASQLCRHGWCGVGYR